LQTSEQRKLQKQVVKLGDRLNGLSASSSSKSTKEIYAWREIFRLYTEAQVFFSSNEQDAGCRDAERASTQLQLFCTALEKQQKKSLKLGKDAKKALDGFMRLNLDLLRFMKYQEINRTAMSKIVKKFDKRTALRAQQSLSPTLAKSPFMVQDLAKATCFTISKELLTVIPQLDDYLCPVCFSISFKPVRLRCNHVFCIRCLIVMQRAGEDHCPLCRREVVMEASRCKFP
jgi:E3 ubiquitin-protein ligase BAH